MRDFVPSGAALLCAISIMAGCSKPESAAVTDTTTAAAAPAAPAAAPAAPANISLADVAGNWNLVSVPESGDTTPTRLVLTATADSTGWTEKFANGLTVKTHVMASGDSIVMTAGPYSSVRRKGVQVTTNGTFRKQGDQLVGETVAHYRTKSADSVLKLNVTGTRAH